MNFIWLKLKPDAIFHLTLSYTEKLLFDLWNEFESNTDMPYLNERYIVDSCNMLIQDELNYNPPSLEIEHRSLYSKLTSEQNNVYTTVINAINSEQGGVFFLYGYGGTGKTFVWKTLSAAIRSKVDIVMSVSSSEVASLLLEGGRTAHSRFGIPINLNEDSFCFISPESDLAALLNKAKLIIWDEAPMMHRHCFEAFNRTLKDIIRSQNSHKPFGGKTILFGGDFRQILHVIPRGEHTDIVNAFLHSSRLWRQCTVLRLTVNMRLQINCPPEKLEETKSFAEWILNVPIILLRNIDQTKGLCNGTRMQVVRLGAHVIEARIISSGKFFYEITYVPRMKLIPSDKRISFRFQQRKFVVEVCFAMTINKSKGHLLANVGLYLRRPVFKHGQFYVAVSRVTIKKA